MSRLSSRLIAALDDQMLLAIVLDGIASGRIPLEDEDALPALYHWIDRLTIAIEQLHQDADD